MDISPQKTHAVVAGREIFKTIRVLPGSIVEEFNLRHAIISGSSTRPAPATLSAKQKDQLAIKDVKWAHGDFDTIIATAAANGRIIIYDLHRPGLELARFNGHNRQVHRLAVNPHRPAWLLSGSQDGTVRMWDLRMASTDRGVANCTSNRSYSGNSDAIRDVRWSSGDGVLFAVAADSGAIQSWDCRYAKAPQLKIGAHDKSCYAVDWHPDGRHLVSAGADKQVKVWDFSASAERRQKPTLQFRAPQPVSNVRWRPPGWLSGSQSTGHWQTTQLVTSYEREDPRLHLWDLRRPHIPFREIDRYDTVTTDFLWRSKDLLWTVNESGLFIQSDIRSATRVVDRRPPGAIAWSPTGDVLSITQKRSKTHNISTSDLLHAKLDAERADDDSFDLPDDGSEDPIPAAFFRTRQHKTSAARSSKSLGNTPPGTDDVPVITPLEKSLGARKSPAGPRQSGVVGHLEGFSMSADLFRYLARHYATLSPDLATKHRRRNPIRVLVDDLNHNAECAEEAGLYKLAQTWRIVRYAVEYELTTRAERARQQQKGPGSPSRKMKPPEGQLGSRTTQESRPEKAKSNFFKGLMETDGRRRGPGAGDAESASNLATPLAVPLPDTPVYQRNQATQLSSLTGEVVDLQPLPPSVISSYYSGRTSELAGSSLSTYEIESRRSQRQTSDSTDRLPELSENSLPDQLRDDLPGDPDANQRSAPRAIAKRADWRRYSSHGYERRVSEDDYEQEVESKRAALRDYQVIPRRIINLEPLASEANRPQRPPNFFRYDSTESFPMFSASTDSSNRAKSIGTSFSPRTPLRIDYPGWEKEDGGMIVVPEEEDTSPLDPGPQAESNFTFPNDFAEVDTTHLDRPSTPPPLIVEQSGKVGESEGPTEGKPDEPEEKDDWDRLSLPLSPELFSSKPWSAEAILKEAVRHYYGGTTVDVQTAAHLLQKFHLLFDRCETILPSHQSGDVFRAYNEQLLRHSMYVEAAELRKFCVPAYPRVYEYAQADAFINVYCYTCNKPYENPVRDNRRCHRCRVAQQPCPICLNLDPPAEWLETSTWGPQSDLPDDVDAASVRSLPPSDATQALSESAMELDSTYSPPRPMGLGLWSWCQGCGHGGHVVCMARWLRDIETSEGGCPTPGCMHDCGPGPRRKENRELMQRLQQQQSTSAALRRSSSNIAKRDSWVSGESRAVKNVRAMLASDYPLPPDAAAAAAGQGAANTISPKKVRLVTPREQGRTTRRESSDVPRP